MLKKTISLSNNKVILSFISVLFFVYIVLFEFILPANKFLPKPSILIETISSLYQDYNFASAFIFSFSALYVMMFITYFLIKIGYKALIYFLESFPDLKQLFKISEYFIPLFLVFLFKLWFGNSPWGEYLFLLILLMGYLKSAVANEYHKIKNEYLESVKSLGLGDDQLLQNVIWKSIQPKIFSIYRKNHILIWMYLLIYEFICKTDGIGNVIFLGLKYNDLSLMILVIGIMIVTFLVMELALNYIKNKYFFWED